MKLTETEKALMEIFWSSTVPLTSVEIANMNIKDTWSKNLIQNNIRKLLKKGLIQECGTVKYNTQYARQFVSIVSKDKFIISVIEDEGYNASSMSKLLMIMIEEGNIPKKQEIIPVLEDVIKKLEEEK